LTFGPDVQPTNPNISFAAALTKPGPAQVTHILQPKPAQNRYGPQIEVGRSERQRQRE